MKRRWFRCAALTLVIALSFVVPASPPLGATAAGAVATELATRLVGDIIDDARRQADQLIANGANQGNSLMIAAGNQLNVLVSNLLLQFANEREKMFRELSGVRDDLLVESELMRRALSGAFDRAAELEDVAVVDLSRLAAQFPFVEQTFFVKSIRGLTLYREPASYNVVLIASLLGIAEDTRTSVSMRILDHEVENLTVDQSRRAGTAYIRIPAAALDRHFDDGELRTVAASINVDVERRRGFIIHRWEKERFSVPVQFTLLPEIAGSVTVSSVSPEFGWVADSEQKSTHQTGNHHCERNCRGGRTRTTYTASTDVPNPATGNQPVAGAQQLRNARFRCISDGGTDACGGWFYIRYVGIEDGGRRMKAIWDVWSHSTTWELAADRFAWRQTGEAPTTVEIPLRFGQLVEVLLPENATTVRVSGRTYLGRTFQFVLGQTDPEGLVRHVRADSGPPGQTRHIFAVTDARNLPANPG